jgi:hypothetical protein
MHISAKTFLVLGLLISTAPAYAQGYAKKQPMINKDHLEHVQFHKSPLQISIEDDGPIVTDRRRVPESKPLIINVPPLRGANGGGAGAPAGAVEVAEGLYVMGGGAPSTSSVNPMIGNRHLPTAGFSSYTPSQPVTAGRNLPSGTTTGIRGRMEQTPSMVSSQPASVLNRPSRSGFAKDWAPAEVAMYDKNNVSVGGATQSSTRTNVKGTILTEMLKKQK